MIIQPIRRKVGRFLAALFFVLPFITIAGESAFRFDVPTLRLHVFGVQIWMQEFSLVLLAIMFLVSLFLLVTFVYGRVWCGWVCPQTVFTDLSCFMDRPAGKSLVSIISAHGILMLLSLFCGFISVCYVVSPYDVIPALLSGNLGPIASGSTVVIAILTYINFAFVRRIFCATICPYGKIQGALTDEKSLLIQLDPQRKDECIECKSCVRVCPTGLDIRKGMQVACIMCARCVDACTVVMAKQKKKSLINYSFGMEGVNTRSELIRPASTVLALVCLFAFSLFVYKSAVRSSFDFSILPHPMQTRVTKSGEVMNAYILSIKNKRREDINLMLSLQPVEKTPLSFRHNINDMVLVEGGLVEKFPLFVRSTGKATEDIPLNITLTADGDVPENRMKSVYFNVP